MKMHWIVSILLLTVALWALSGCRYRIINNELESPAEEPPLIEYAQPLQDEPQETPTDIPHETTRPDPETTPPDTEEPPYEDINISYIEASVDDFSPLVVQIEETDARRYATEEVVTTDDQNQPSGTATQEADNIITIEQPTATEDDAVIGDDGGVVGLIAAYSTLLRRGVNTIFPCQQLNIYVETTEVLTTVARGAEIYRLIENAGGLHVSSRLSADMLVVTSDWVVRRNPDMIVKFVDASVLGQGIIGTHAASDVLASLTARPDWSAIEAVRNSRVLILSVQMLDTEATRLAAQLLIAYMMYPELFVEIDMRGTVNMLMDAMDGIYFYGL